MCSPSKADILAPLSGNTLVRMGGVCCNLGNEGDIDTLICSSIAWTLTDVAVVDTALTFSLWCFLRKILAKWFGISQLWHMVLHAGQ